MLPPTWSLSLIRGDNASNEIVSCCPVHDRLMCLMLGIPPIGNAQSRRQIKVLVESQQSGAQNQESLQGSGSVIIRKGNVYPSGRVTGGDRQTTVQRSTGIFTLVQDGGESILSVATQVPYSQTAYYYNYAVGSGYIQSADRVHQCRNIASCQCRHSSRQPDQSALDSENQLFLRRALGRHRFH